MASPVGHALAGYAVGQLKGEDGKGSLYPVALCLFMALAPDLDFLPGLLLDQPARFHGEHFHSLGFALVASLVAAGFLKLSGQPFSRMFILGFLAYLSHLGLDMLQPDGRVPYGIPFLWPFYDGYLLSPVPLFLGVHHVPTTSSTTVEFVRGVLQPHNLLTIAFEIVVLGPFVFFRHWKAGLKALGREVGEVRTLRMLTRQVRLTGKGEGKS